MLDPSPTPEELQDRVWDVIVVGTGMGGSTVGYELARRGHQVLYLEKGHYLFGDFDRGEGQVFDEDDDRPQVRLQNGWWPLPLQGRTTFGEIEFFAPLGCGTGGSSGLYAAQLERLSPLDFEPGAHYRDVEGSTLPETWPISYGELVPYYRQAELLFGVHGTEDPLNPDPESPLKEPPPLSERDQILFDSFARSGLHPYRAHVGFGYVDGCEECGGALCPRDCKRDAGRVCLLPAVTDHGARVLADCEAKTLLSEGERVTGVQCSWRGEEKILRARIVILGAGAYMSPLLLLSSRSEEWPEGLANRSGQVGRNLMLHSSDFIAVRPPRAASPRGPKKAIAVNDFYVAEGKKLGTLQSVGIEVNAGYVLHYLRSSTEKDPRWWRRLARPFLRFVARGAAYHFRHAAMFASIVEDLPYHENRIVPDPSARNGMRFEYRYTDDLKERNRLFRRLIQETIGRENRVAVLTPENNINYGHACGTCRFGADPASSVLDRNNRAHDVQNLYVVDASFFPSSGGTNPSLTIAANALRVAEAVDRQLSE